MNVPFMESVAEEQRPAVESFITNSGAKEEDLTGYKSFDEFLSGYKPKQTADWVSGIPEEDKGLLTTKGWKTPADTIKSYKELEKLVGHDKIAMPRKDKDGNYDPADFDRVMTQLGRPKDPKEYKVSPNFKLPANVSTDDKFVEMFNIVAHKAGLLPHQYSLIMDEFAALTNQGVQAQKEAQEKAYNDAALDLRKKRGLAYDQDVKLANLILRNYSEEKREEIVKKYGNDPLVIELLANIGKDISEDSITKAAMSGTLLSPEAARLEIDKIRREQTDALLKSEHPEHTYWVNKLDTLYKMCEA